MIGSSGRVNSPAFSLWHGGDVTTRCAAAPNKNALKNAEHVVVNHSIAGRQLHFFDPRIREVDRRPGGLPQGTIRHPRNSREKAAYGFDFDVELILTGEAITAVGIHADAIKMRNKGFLVIELVFHEVRKGLNLVIGIIVNHVALIDTQAIQVAESSSDGVGTIAVLPDAVGGDAERVGGVDIQPRPGRDVVNKGVADLA